MEQVPSTHAADELSALRRLYPTLSDRELQEVQERLDRYVDLIARITERIASDPDACEQFRKLVDKCGEKDL